VSAPEAPARPAATVILARPGPSAPELMLLRRSGQAGFFPDAWVFPGGRVDPRDGEVACSGAVPGLPEADRAFAVAAVREAFEESGVWLGAGLAGAALRRALNARELSLPDAPGLRPDLGRLAWWSWWITPVVEPRRYDTRFFLACLDAEEGADASPDDAETVDLRWISAADALAQHADGGLPLAPPTWVTLMELCGIPDLPTLRAAGAARRPTPVRPRLDRGADGSVVIVLPGDPTLPDPHPVAGPTRVVRVGDRWVFG